MDLKTYIKRKHGTNMAFAAAAGLSKSFVGRLVTGKCMPSWEMVMKIKTATEGKVTERDWARSVPVAREESAVAQ
jgi:hypothetical protein